jgi:hypothetical protein
MDGTMIDYIPINLQNYIGKEVTAILRNGKKLVDRIIYDNQFPNYPYKFSLRCYTKEGRTLIDNNCPSDIAFLWVEEKEDKELEEKLRKATEKVMMNNQEILNSLNEKIKAAEESLLYLNQTKEGIVRMIANSKKSPVEEAYKDWCGEYPSGTSSNASQWVTFQAGYNAAYEEKVVEEDLKKAFRESVKQGVVSSNTKPQTLYEICEDWYGDGYDYPPITVLVDRIKNEWFPAANEGFVDGEYSVGWNDGFNDYRIQLMEKLK